MTLRIVPLGGLGEIGMNCLALEQPDGILVVDAGTCFPSDDLGVDVIHPDFTWLEEHADRVAGVFLTHGHEDHIGALPYLLARIDVPVYGPPHALALAKRRLSEHEFRAGDLDLHEVPAGSVIRVGPFEVETLRVSHSIVEASALCIGTAEGYVVHTGDFTFDSDPPDGQPTDETRLAALGARGVEVLLSDSTNIDTEERPGSERGVGAALSRIVAGAPGRVIVALFASNVQRLILLGEIAAQSGRKLALLGRSLQSQREIASALGHLRWPSNLVVAPEDIAAVPRERLLVLAGGTQAEPNSAMSRLAAGVHPHLSLDEGDSVVFSSRVIPGNERPVLGLMNDLMRRGLRLHHRGTDPDVHTSGHAGRTEQRRMIELTSPRAFVPIHGTLSHLLRHAELARDAGVDQTRVIENGQTVHYSRAHGLTSGDRAPSGRVAVDLGGEPLAGDDLKRRAELGRSGLLCVSVTIDDRGEVTEPPVVSARGVPAVDGSDTALRGVARDVLAALARVRGWRGVDLEDEVRRAARRSVTALSGARPVVEVLLSKTSRS